MKLKDIVQLLEDLVFEVISWIVFFPITLVYAGKLKGAHAYVAAAYAEQDPEKRYPGGLSPILFYFIAVVLAAVVIEGRFDLSLDLLDQVSQAGLLLSALQAFSVPLVAALPFWLALAWRERPVRYSKDSLRRMFETQCLVWPLLYLWGVLLTLLLAVFPLGPGEPTLFEILFAVVIGLFSLYALAAILITLLQEIEASALPDLVQGLLALASLGWVLAIVRYGLPGNFVFAGVVQLLGP